jgi:polyisoprenoid-binding protein YceI
MTAEAFPATLPLATGTWQLDPNHSGIEFKIRHLGLTNVRGRFNSFSATLAVGDTLADTSVGAVIDVSTIDTNQADRDAHLRSTDFFSADAHPTMVFRSVSISETGDDYALAGELTLNGITKPVTLDVEFNGVETHPGDGMPHAGFTATGELDRDDFGIDFNMPLGMDKLALGKKVKVELDLQFIAPAD